MEKNAKQSYADMLLMVKNELKALEKKLIKHESSFNKSPENWGYVGDLHRVMDGLKDIL